MVLPNPALILPQLIELHTDAQHISVRLAAIEDALRALIANTAPADPTYNNSSSNTLQNSLVVKSGAGKLFGFSGYNNLASTQFSLGFDQTAIPANGAVPEFVMKAPASENFWVSWAPNWRPFQEGWVICNSSTPATLTLGAANCWFDAQYV